MIGFCGVGTSSNHLEEKLKQMLSSKEGETVEDKEEEHAVYANQWRF